MRFADPAFLILLVLPLLLWWWAGRRGGEGAPFPSAEPLAGLPVSLRQRLHAALPVLRMAVLALTVLAIARPQWGVEVSTIEREGITINLVVDVSTSMSALDLELNGQQSNRLEVAKASIEGFIAGEGEETTGRDGDAIGLVAFARYANAISPPTLDHKALLALMDQLVIVENPDDDGTAIGDAMMLGIERLRDSGDAGRVMILLTDGSHNAGEAEPVEAAEVARALGIKVYTIGAGTKGMALMPTPTRSGGIQYVPSQVFIDEFVLERIAELTNGRYFRATDGEALKAIYAEIDRLEKGVNVVNYHQQYRELFPAVLALALVLLLVEVGLSTTWLRTAP